ncbi:MAG: amidohydrolase [Beijerinckiaceae bacterium]|nr:amidohydrolase [Beijerinckiaceae bacterium]
MPLPAGKIDVHHHCLPEFYKDVQRAAGIGGTAYQGFPEWTPEKSLALMDKLNIAATVFSFTSPGIFFGDLVQTRELAVQFNDYLAGLKKQSGGRFGGFAFLPLPDVDAAIAEIGRVQDELGLEGVCLLTSVDDRYIGDRKFWPVYEELHKRKMVAFLHPCYPPGTEATGWDIPRMLIDYPFETTKVATNLIFNGVMEQLPDIKWILSHAGGTLPMLAHRISIFDTRTKFKDKYPKGALHYIRQFYFDTALSGAKPPLDALMAFADPARIVFGTDYPYVVAEVAESETRGFEAYAGWTAGQRAAIERSNAMSLFGYV